MVLLTLKSADTGPQGTFRYSTDVAADFRSLDATQTEGKSFRSRYSKTHKRTSKGNGGRLKYCANMSVGKSKCGN